MSGVDALHLLEVAVRPALRILGEPYATTAAEQLVMSTGAVESGFRYLRQHRGPALGLWQMEPATYRDLIDRASNEMAQKLREMAVHHGVGEALPCTMCWNLRYGAAMCRIKYLDHHHPLPEPGDVQGFAIAWKAGYNSLLGAGTIEGFKRAWADLIAPRYSELWPHEH